MEVSVEASGTVRTRAGESPLVLISNSVIDVS